MTSGGGTRLRPGDVLSVQTNGRKWHMCYIGRHASLGDTVWVSSQNRELAAALDCHAFMSDGYYVFYPATAAIRRKMITRAGYCPEGMRMMPRLFRYSSPLVREGESQIWRIAEDARVGTPFVIRDSLTVEEAELPEAAIWNHEFLLERLRTGWHPRHDASDHSPEAV